ncbi:hypothetical protein BLA60_19290 [Actinophytocola xinjiangensis]|uniref:DUF2537 domain-containing protein n=1 Tax=Actinophytocola xinjiangensis TaxID=485602 RepID=A0A7Z0WNQ7_9PSEU|nr:DUF2537 domain-containing protein [Actinophytocola xinjiangensis]OLF09327.1 hypothetical protein BLA60_19290 [Actinophytocola xinjiangensis]
MQLRANGERAVLVGHDGTARREVDPRRLPLGGELTDALHEWARVASVVGRGDPDTQPAARAVITRRGLQLAGRVAASMGVPVGYLDPLTGEERTVEPPAVRARPAAPAEPTPWLTGLTVAGTSLVLTVVTVVTLAATLADTNVLLGVAANAVVTAGLLPSLWLVRRALVWRWVSYGVGAGIALSWLALPFIVW